MAKPLIPHASFVRLLKAAAASKRVSEDEVIDTELADWLGETRKGAKCDITPTANEDDFQGAQVIRIF